MRRKLQCISHFLNIVVFIDADNSQDKITDQRKGIQWALKRILIGCYWSNDKCPNHCKELNQSEFKENISKTGAKWCNLNQ